MSAPLADTVRKAYLQGISEGHASGPLGDEVPTCSLWRRAQFEHAQTSWYGAAFVRRMRAYWIGRRRGSRLEL